jgi:diguanylate cyclase (GGDEF)-like protein
MNTRGRRGRVVLLVGLPALVAVGAMVASRLVHAPILTWDVAWTAGAASAVAGTWLARQCASGANRFRWTMWTAGATLWLLGQLAWNYYGAHVPPSPNLGDLGWWGFAVCSIVGVIRSPAGSRTVRAVALVETVPLVAAAMALTTALLWHPMGISSLHLSDRIAVLVYPALYVGAAVVTLQALLGGWLHGEHSGPARLILAGIVIQAVTFSLWSKELLDQTYVQGSTLLDPSFVIGLLVMAAGGAWATMTPEPVVAVEQPAARGGLLPGMVFGVLCAALIQTQLTHGPTAPRLALALGLLCSGAALMLRGHLLARRLRKLLDQERGTVADLAERESALSRINRRLAEDSRHDALTGMRNRRALAYDLPRIEAEHRELGEPFAVALCDVDHFKPYNDRLGHLAGDQALRTISGILRAELREGDVGYRFGGEELMLILRATRTAEAKAAAERIREAVLEAAIPHPDGIGGILTISVGVSAGREDASALIAHADAALYEAKRTGRNRVIAASDEDGLDQPRNRRSGDEESVPRQMRSMLTLSRAAASGAGALPVLKALGDIIRVELSFEVVAVNLRDFDTDQLEVVLVTGDEEARKMLLGTTNPWSEFASLMVPEYERCGAYWLPHGTIPEYGLNTWDPAIEVEDDPLAWHPEDMLLLPLRAASGEVIGVVSVDQPLSGRRPDDNDLSILMAVIDHAGLAVERAQQDSRDLAARDEQAGELRLAAVMLLAETLDLRDPGTGRHSRTVGIYAQRTAAALGLPPDRVERIQAAGVVHDLGKLGIADAILYKEGPLDAHEWREMKRHPEVGERILDHAGLHDIARWVRAHHERVDGLGYPDELPAEAIPLEARILAVADAYEAMIADRPYRLGMSAEDARAELLRCAGTQFDSDVVSAFLSTLAEELEPDLDRLGVPG